MEPAPVLLVALVSAGCLLAVAAGDRPARLASRWWPALVAVPLVTGALLAAYVFGEDTYRRNGISRWEAYVSPGGALGPMFVLSVALMATCAGLLAYSSLRGRLGLLRLTALGGAALALCLVIPTVVGFNLN